MRRYTITINGTQHVIDVAEESADVFTVFLDGEQVQVQLTEDADLAQAEITPAMTGGFQSYQRPEDQGYRAPAPRPQGRDSVAGGHVPAAAAVSRPKPAAAPVAPTPAAAPAAGGAGDMTAPMPGVVLSIEAKPGQTVSRGDIIMVLEAMKMKNEIRATREGQIAEIPVSEGAQVKFGETLVRFA